jgi:hypothetical protein
MYGLIGRMLATEGQRDERFETMPVGGHGLAPARGAA